MFSLDIPFYRTRHPAYFQAMRGRNVKNWIPEPLYGVQQATQAAVALFEEGKAVTLI